MWWERIKKEIVDTDLYSRSGTIAGLASDKLQLVECEGEYNLKKIRKGDVPEIAYKACCDKEINYPDLNKEIFGKLPEDWRVGNYKKIFIGYAKNEEIRKNAGSAGVISRMQLYLLNSGRIDGAITTVMSEDKPYLSKPIIATNGKDIKRGSQSKYSVSPTNLILSELPGEYNSLAYTGLPEQVAAIRKLQKFDHESVKNINYTFGPFYGETYKFSAIKSLLRAHGEKDISKIKSLKYREGEWPGYMKIKLEGGKEISIRKLHANYLIPSHITKYSLFQVDYMNELTDVSVGDAWAPSYEQRGEGWSVVVARTDKGLELIEEMRSKNKLSLEEITKEELLKMHSHGIDFKKRGAFIRIGFRKKMGLPVPEYGYKPVNISITRKVFEIILDGLFWVFQLKITIWFLELLPTDFIGWFFRKARNFWKFTTKTTKKGGLNDLEFEMTN